MPVVADPRAGGTPEPAPQTILVVDDDEYVHAALRAALRTTRATLVEASSAHEGLSVARERRPDLAIVDVGLPDVDGYELTRRLRAEPGLGHLRVLILTGHTPDAPAAREAGADAILGKPFRMREFLAAVRDQLDPKSAAG